MFRPAGCGGEQGYGESTLACQVARTYGLVGRYKTSLEKRVECGGIVMQFPKMTWAIKIELENGGVVVVEVDVRIGFGKYEVGC